MKKEVKYSSNDKLDNRDYIVSIDKYGLLRLIERFPEQIDYAVDTLDFKVPEEIKDFSSIGIVGVGTTRVCAEIIKSLMDRKGKIPVLSFNDYSLPDWVEENTLLIFVSFSGNTEEVLSCFTESLARKCFSIVITSGGVLQDEALRKGITVVKIKKENPPNRTVLPYMIVPIMLILRKMGFLSFQVDLLQKTADLLREKRLAFSVDSSIKSNIAKRIAWYFLERIPLIYTDEPLYSGVILRWQYQLNENAKILAYSSKLPEMSHNEVIGLYGTDFSSLFAPVFLTSGDYPSAIGKRLSYTKSVMEEKGYSVMNIPLLGDDDLQKIFYGLYLGDFVSFYLAILRGVDPHAVELIDKIRLSGINNK